MKRLLAPSLLVFCLPLAAPFPALAQDEAQSAAQESGESEVRPLEKKAAAEPEAEEPEEEEKTVEADDGACRKALADAEARIAVIQEAAAEKIKEALAEVNQEKAAKNADSKKEKARAKSAAANLEFLERTFAAASKKALPSLISEAGRHLEHYGDLPGADKALLFRARIREKQSKHAGAVLDILKLLYEYPETKIEFKAKKILLEIAGKRLRKQKEELVKIAKGPEEGLDRPARAAAMLRAVAEIDVKNFYAPVIAELGEFLRRYPDDANTGEMTLLLGRAQARAGNHDVALIFDRKVLATSKDPVLGARAQSAIGDIYAKPLKDYDKAVGAYQAVIDRFPKSDEAGAAYVKMARIMDKNLKQPALAVEILEKITQLYPGTAAAYEAFLEMARIHEDRLDQPAKAVTALEAAAEMFEGERAVKAMLRAAKVSEEAKDYAGKTKLLEKLAEKYPADQAAPKALWDAAMTYEKRLDDAKSAMKIYEKIVSGYASTRTAKKAKKRIKALSK